MGSKLLVVFIYLLSALSVSRANCQTKTYSLLDSEETRYKTCPGPDDPDHFTDCCGPSWERYCCPRKAGSFANPISYGEFYDDGDNQYPKTSFESLPTPQPRLGGKSVLKFVGVIIGIILFIAILTLVCCCCLPCCICAQRRTRRGVIHGPTTTTTTTTVMPGQQQASYPIQQTGVVPPPSAYQPQPPQHNQYSDLPPPYPGPPLQGYPPNQAYPPNQSYPPEYQTAEASKQPAYNPNMM